ncbi:MAG: hypothetical protein IT406_04200 [Candidatus Yanofskybacteria bacterium]|nr:hypothetical protein [Candidatus Yanofskybacteria bacterium]
MPTPKPKPFKLDPAKRRAVSAQEMERGQLESEARNTEADDMRWFFRELGADCRWHLSRLAMTRRGRRLIIEHLRSVYLEESKKLDAVVSDILKRSRAHRR